MNYKKCLEAASAALMMVIVALLLAPGAWAQGKFKTLHKFTESEGVYPDWIPTFDTAGNLYGAACHGGAHGYGVVFKLAPNADGSWTESSLYDFTGGDDGSCPLELLFDAAGNLYSATVWGGAYGGGVVFELTPNSDGTWTESVLHAFTAGADGSYPDAPLIFDATGALYGTFVYSGAHGWGGVFKLTPNSDGTWSESVLYAFTGGKDGGHPVTGLIFDAAGNLYGTTYWGANRSCNQGCGVVFKLTPNGDGGWTESVLHTFTGGKDGAYPTGWLISDAAGNLYGATDIGGLYGDGVVFKLAPGQAGSWKILHQFTGGGRAAWGGCGLTFDAAGNLYGTRNVGGAYQYGLVFKLAPTSSGGWKETVLHAFDDKPGAYPDGGVTFDVAGNLYGMTSGDGSKTFGSVYEITP
jgi:uncharacterized repeat protein (TIGR03803 family)